MRIFIYAIIVLQLLIFSSCSKEEESSINSFRKIKKIETTLENSGRNYTDKNTTLMSEREREELNLIMSKMYYKTTTKVQEVGIISHGTCGQYKSLEIFMDCEDKLNASWIHNNPASNVNWGGDITLDSKGNILLKFCLVPNDFARCTAYQDGYAVLATDLNTYDKGVELWRRAFDNENDANMNYALLGGSQVQSYQANDFIYDFGGTTDPNNTLLHFAYFPWKDSLILDFPPSYGGIPYSAFGKGPYGSQYVGVEIQIDDEDKDCMNATWMRTSQSSAGWNPMTVSQPGGFQGTAYVPGVFNFTLPSLSQLYVVQFQ